MKNLVIAAAKKAIPEFLRSKLRIYFLAISSLCSLAAAKKKAGSWWSTFMGVTFEDVRVTWVAGRQAAGKEEEESFEPGQRGKLHLTRSRVWHISNSRLPSSIFHSQHENYFFAIFFSLDRSPPIDWVSEWVYLCPLELSTLFFGGERLFNAVGHPSRKFHLSHLKNPHKKIAVAFWPWVNRPGYTLPILLLPIRTLNCKLCSLQASLVEP